MRMDGETDIGGISAHLDRERHFADQFTRVAADDTATEHPMGLRVEQQFREPFIAPLRQRPAARRPRETSFLVLDALGLGFGLGEPDPGDLRVGVRDRGDHASVEGTLFTGDHLGGDLALVGRFVGQHRLTDDVTDREDVWLRGAHLPIDRQESVRIDGQSCRLGTDARPVRSSADRHQHPIVDLRRRCARAAEAHAQPLGQRLDALHLHAEQDLLVTLTQTLLERFDEVGVGTRHQLVHQFDHAHLAAERVVDAAHLEPDDPTADHQKPLRDVLKLERGSRVHHPRIVRQERQPHGLRTGCDDAMVEADALSALLACDLEHARRDETTVAPDDRHFSLTGKTGEAPGELADDRRFPAAQSVEVDLRRTERDAVTRHRLSLIDHARCMEQRLGGDTAHIETDTTQDRPALDEGDLEAEVRGTERRGVAARPRAEHQYLGMTIGPGHGSSLHVRSLHRNGRRCGDDRGYRRHRCRWRGRDRDRDRCSLRRRRRQRGDPSDHAAGRHFGASGDGDGFDRPGDR